MTSHADLTLDTSDVPPWHRVSTIGTIEVKPRTVVVESNVLVIVEHAGQTSQGATSRSAGGRPRTFYRMVSRSSTGLNVDRGDQRMAASRFRWGR